MKITLKNINTDELVEIACKTWSATKNGIIYKNFSNEWIYDLENYEIDTDLIAWSIEK